MQVARDVLALCHGAATIAQPQLSSVKATFVVPVRGERLNRVARLLQSLADQRTTPHTIEVLLVVNNTPYSDNEQWQRAFALNQQYLQPGLWQPYGRRMNVHALDLSSGGKWIAGCNVGIARQHGLVTAVSRFALRGHNGIVIHTDADCRFEDPTFVDRLLWLFANCPEELIAYGGSYTLEAEPNDPEAPGLSDKVAGYQLVRRYTAMRDALAKGSYTSGEAYLLGSCAAHKAYEGVLAGGFPATGICEDVVFGEALQRYAAQHGKTVDYSNPWGLGPVTAFRLSDRTDNANTKRYLAMVGTGGGIEVDDIFGNSTAVLDDAYIARMVTATQAIPGGRKLLEHLFLTSPMARLRVARA